MRRDIRDSGLLVGELQAEAPVPITHDTAPVTIEGDGLDPALHMARLERLIARLEDINAQIADLNGDKRQLYAAAKETGYDVGAIRGAIKRRAAFAAGRNPVQQEAILTAYLSALGDPLPLAPDDAARALAASAVARDSRASAQRRARLDRHFMMIEG